MLAHAAKEFVEAWPRRKERARAERERRLRGIAAFQAAQVGEFWARISGLADARERLQEEEESGGGEPAPKRRRRRQGQRKSPHRRRTR